jgi:predicted AlkP superfamily phosphohydrolase/phosphomutase
MGSPTPPPLAGLAFKETGQATATPTREPPTLLPSTVIPSSLPQPPPKADSVLLISWSGASHHLVSALMSEGVLPQFSELAERGMQAEHSLGVEPCMTVPAHASLASGSFPARTGLVSNRYHLSSDSFYWYRFGSDEHFDQAEPVWLTAARAGYSTATAFFPTGSPSLTGQLADYSIGSGIREAYGSQQTISLHPASVWQNAPHSYSSPLEGSFSIPDIANIYLLVTDSLDDGISEYNIVILNTAPIMDNVAIQVGGGEWGSLVLKPETDTGADFLIQAISPGFVTLYHSSINHNAAQPPGLLANLNEQFSFSPPEPDLYALQKGWISLDDYFSMVERSSLWMADVTAWLATEYHPDLLFTSQDVFYHSGQTLLPADIGQHDNSNPQAGGLSEYFLNTAVIADRALQRMLAATDLERTGVLMVSDCGLVPVHTTVYVNTLLEKAGLLTLDHKNYVVVAESRAFAIASGGVAHLYINLQGRERAGIVPLEDYAWLQYQIIQLFSALEDPTTGEPVFHRILTREQLVDIALHHANAGDVFIQARPGYELDGWRGKDAIFAPALRSGGQGFDCQEQAMHGFFIAAGAGIPSLDVSIPPVNLTDYAPTIAALLGFEPVHSVDGFPIPAIPGR